MAVQGECTKEKNLGSLGGNGRQTEQLGRTARLASPICNAVPFNHIEGRFWLLF